MESLVSEIWQFNWQAFHFIRPTWLVAALPLTIIAFLLKRMNAKKSGWQGIVASHLYQHMVISKDKKAATPPFYLLGLCWLLACIAMAGPTWQKLPQPVYQVNTGKVLIMDMSLSMRATDITPDRLTRAKFKAIDLLKSIDDGEVGLVVYAGDAFTVSPLTSDVSNIIALIPSLRPEIMPIAGSYPLAAFEEAQRLLTQAGYTKGEIYWMTDGIDMDEVAPLRKQIASSDYQVSILGVGSEAGAPIKQIDGSLLKDNRGNIVIPGLQSRYLRQVASGLNTRYTPISIDDSDIKAMTIDSYLVDQEQVEDEILGEGDQWQDMGAFVVLLFLPFAAYAFRRGVLVLVLTTFLYAPSEAVFAQQPSNGTQATIPDMQASPSMQATPEKAQTSQISAINNAMFKTNDQLGQTAFEAGNFDEAAQLFEDPMWKAGALYEAGDYQGALDTYQQLDGLESQYNQGNALAKLGDLQAALDAYSKVLESDPQHQNAQKNKQIVEKLLEQQQEQESQDSQGDESQNQDSQDSQSNDSESQESDSQNSDSQNSDSQNQDSQNSDSQQDSQSTSDENSQNENAEANEDEQQNSENMDAQSQQDEQDQNDASEQEQQSQEDSEQKSDETETQQSASASQKEEPLTQEQIEQMQRDRVMLNKVPDDPAYLLQRKMLLESQQRKRERLPSASQKEW